MRLASALFFLVMLLVLLLLGHVTLAAADESTLIARPRYVRLAAGIGAPSGLLGVVGGGTVAGPVAIEGVGGVGVTGWQLGVLGRAYHPVVGSRSLLVTAAAGPSLSLLSESLGRRVVHTADVDPSQIFYVLGLNAEVGLEVRSGFGGVFHVAVGGFLRLSENMTETCTGSCPVVALDSPFPTAHEVAGWWAYPYGSVAYGFAF